MKKADLRRPPIRRNELDSPEPDRNDIDHGENDSDHGENDSDLGENDSEFKTQDGKVCNNAKGRRKGRKSPDHSDEVIQNKINENLSKNEKNSYLKWVIPLFVVIFACCKWKSYEQTPDISTENRSTRIIRDLKTQFDSQPSLGLTIIKKALKRVLDVQDGNQPSHPAILLLLSTKGAKDITTCFAKKMALMLSQADNGKYENISGSVLKNEDASIAKKKIDVSIKDALQNKGLHVVLIEDLDLIPFDAVMMLHTYCDHENAPFKKAIFIMTIDGKQELHQDSDSKKYDEVASTRLKHSWRGQHVDQQSALLTRLTVSVVAILPSAKFSKCNT